MFQKFHSSSDRDAGPARLEKLREAMREEDVTIFLVPHADEHQNEYLPARAERLAWLTGFTGSAGFAVATLQSCVVFVDGRYTLQIKDQIHPDYFEADNSIENPPSKWLEKNTTDDDVIGYDPWLTTINQLEVYKKACAKSGAKLKPVANLIDKVWVDQPDAPKEKVFRHFEQYAGVGVAEKLNDIQQTIADKSCDLTVLTDPASLAWLFNIRGNDVAHNPLALGFAIVPANGKPILFIDGQKIDEEVGSYLSQHAELREPDTLLTCLKTLSADKAVLTNLNQTAVVLADTIKKAGGKCISGRDPVVLPRAIKNEIELEGARNAHIRDGVAICKFLYWLDHQKPETVSEISAAQKLEEIRAQNAKAMGSELLEISFDTISGSGPNGAIVHYRVTHETDRIFENNSLYLCDSGGQYVDGTTDITRTIAIGTPPEKAITDFTLVLKGHIAIATARFPEGTRGVDIDVLARKALWEHGKDFAHGTGHGVGSYLNVHEGPQSISRRGMEPLKAGMIISNEPGYYVEDEYGIRIENLVIVNESEAVENGNIKTQSFETITFAPIDKRLINSSMLDDTEKEWLNTYHRDVRSTLEPYLTLEEQAWLETATNAI